jgi:hypothetical protein
MDFDWCEQQTGLQKFEPFNNSILQTISAMTHTKIAESVETPKTVASHSPFLVGERNKDEHLFHTRASLTNQQSSNSGERSSPSSVGGVSQPQNGWQKPIVDIANCFDLTTVKNNTDVGNALQYLYQITNSLRNTVREDNAKFDFDRTLKYLYWVRDMCLVMKNIFISNKTGDGERSNQSLAKLFKTSSYNFCHMKETCPIHNERRYGISGNCKKCNKHHFVFNFIVVDIENLIKSLETIGSANTTFVFDGGMINYDVDGKVTQMSPDENLVGCFNPINKNTICKCFDVVSYVINKMSYEINCFLTYGLTSNYAKLF